MLGPERLNKKFLEAFGWENDVVDEDVVQQLLEDGADINVADNHICTSLIRSATSGKVRAVELLLEKKADVNIKTEDGSL